MIKEVLLSDGSKKNFDLRYFAKGEGYRQIRTKRLCKPNRKQITIYNIYKDEEGKKFVQYGNNGSLFEIVSMEIKNTYIQIKTEKYTFRVWEYKTL